MSLAAFKPAQPPTLQWWTDPKMLSLVKRTSFRSCNETEFDEAVAVARELRLSPLRKQIYAFVFSADKPDKRNMVLVVGIDGARAITARTAHYRPDNRAPRYATDEAAKNADSNPLGLVSAEVSVFMFSNNEWHEVVGIAYWDEFAPLIETVRPEDMVETGETWPDGNPKKRKRQGAVASVRLDPKKDGWRKSARHMLAKCAEMIALRKGWPEDLARVYAEEETHKGQTIEGDFVDLTPSEMVTKGEATERLARIGGPAILACGDDTGILERIEFGKFADWALECTNGKPAEWVAIFVTRNTQGLNEFWAHNKTDALALKKELEKRSEGAFQAGAQ